MKRSLSLLLTSLITCAAAQAGLQVYEPFDYQPHNNEEFGRLEGRNGGIGFASPWEDTDGRGNDGHAFIYDERGNPEELYDGTKGQGKPTWDGVVDNLPTMGGYVGNSDWNISGNRMNANRKLAQSAGEMARANRGVLWLSAVWHFPERSYFAPVGIALTSKDGALTGRAHNISNGGDGIGTGNGRDFKNGRMRLNAMCWQNGNDVSFTPASNMSGSEDNIVVLKFEFGETDTVRTWFFTENEELTEEAFNQNAVSASTTLDEDTLDTLAFSSIRQGNAVDEFRIGTDFRSVISGSIPERQEVKIKRALYDPPSDRYYLEWTSNPGENYGVYLSKDAGGYRPCIAAAVAASTDQSFTSFGPFENPQPGNPNLRFEVDLPDLTPPTLERAWGNANTISLHFNEPMLPTTALDVSNYAVVQDGDLRIAVDSAQFHPGKNTVVLTTEQPLDPAASFTVTTRQLSDLANLPLDEEAISFRTWDDNPNGVKVFILAGQSNMVGRGMYDKGQGDAIGGVGSLREQIEKDPTELGYLLDGDGAWKPIETMKFWWNRADLGGGPRINKGDLTVGYGAGPDCIGPEYGFGWAIHEIYGDQPVLLIKIAWGGKSLHVDYSSPTAAARRDSKVGPYYIQMMDQVGQVLHNLGEHFPEFTGKGYQIAGFGWHQGYNDMINEEATNAYEKNMAMFIRDIRAEFGKPKLPFSIATTGHGGMKVTLEDRPTLAGQLAVADPAKYPEFAGNVFTIDTRPLQRTVEESPKNDGSHWNNNGHTLWLIGKGMGDGMVEMLRE